MNTRWPFEVQKKTASVGFFPINPTPDKGQMIGFGTTVAGAAIGWKVGRLPGLIVGGIVGSMALPIVFVVGAIASGKGM